MLGFTPLKRQFAQVEPLPAKDTALGRQRGGRVPRKRLPSALPTFRRALPGFPFAFAFPKEKGSKCPLGFPPLWQVAPQPTND
ncbi:hypothetical protein A6770_23510 [Nostoc minutum NIES-26]|uniref:Uncharacterized protein n=1 Tax=Nostoc minutum NIES-26 TaxID=1844469 RepID=A0A367QW52_9NOSO|nr:hypothetical protein A6770_23510 [Nostoc minutum NIES-26]